MTGADLSSVTTIDNEEGHWQSARPYDRNRSVYLLFLKGARSEYWVYAWGSAFPQDGGGLPRGKIEVKHSAVCGAIDDLRAIWQRSVLDRTGVRDQQKYFPFIDEWNVSSCLTRTELDEVWLDLARAGNHLFSLVFEANADEGMREITSHLIRALRRGDQIITLESDDLFIPWGMLYTPADGDDLWQPGARCTPSSFWGYSHLVEHNFSRAAKFDSRLTIEADRLVVGLNVDERVDDEYPPTPFVQPLIAFFGERTKTVIRRSKEDLAVALQDPAYADHIVYFGCHCRSDDPGTTPYLALGDGQRIDSTEFYVWLSRGKLPSRPIVFVGACKGGRMSTAFYPFFGQHMLDFGARCLLGPQTDLPRAFAREYAKRLFSLFLTPETQLGNVVRDLARDFSDHCSNPLGLVFSLYRGLDVHLWKDADA